MKLLLILAAVLLQASQGQAQIFQNLYKDSNVMLAGASSNTTVGDPLILTSYIQDGRIQQGQAAALVQSSIFLNVTSYAGYFTVDNRFNSNLWFWYFPSADNVTEDPVVLWLNGGPGSSSLNGLFDENGPFLVNANGSVSLREYSWHRNQSLIFIDNPVGVGFSFTNGGLAENETKVGEDMYQGLVQFFQLFPELQNNDFFLSGESYAGKYLPAIGYTILHRNPEAALKINLKGILIGDGWTDPVNQLNYGPFVYNTGLVSASVREVIDSYRDQAIAAVNAGDWLNATDFSNAIYETIENVSDVNIYNYVLEYGDDNIWLNFIDSDAVRLALHVGDTPFGDKGAGDALAFDEMKGVTPWLEELINNYPVLEYVGQLDIICAYPTIVDLLNTFTFNGVEEYKNSTRRIWYVDGEAAGYVRKGGNLTELLVRNAGHMVPRDQPKWAYEMLYKFIRNQSFA